MRVLVVLAVACVCAAAADGTYELAGQIVPEAQASVSLFGAAAKIRETIAKLKENESGRRQ